MGVVSCVCVRMHKGFEERERGVKERSVKISGTNKNR